MLIRAFVDWARLRLADDIDRVERYFHPGLFEPELPGRYALPAGSLLIAYDGDTPVGCVGLRDIGEGACEMKRMFVTARARGQGVGRMLVQQLVADAKFAGYGFMRLDTSMHRHEAMALYEKAGFRPIAPYYQVPDDLRDWLRYYELRL